VNPFVGQSYNLSSRKADVQRSINWYPISIESGSGKSPAMLKRAQGLKTFSAVSADPIRGGKELNGRAFVVAGSKLYEVDSSGTATMRGTLLSASGPVSMEFNQFQLVIVDGTCGYYLNLASNAFSQISDPDFPACKSVVVVDGYAIVTETGTGQFNISAINDASSWATLDFANAEAYPDNVVAAYVIQRQTYFLGLKSLEVWQNTGAADFPFQRTGAVLDIGCNSPFTVQRVGSGVMMFLGSDERGGPVVWGVEGYLPRRLSTIAIEQSLTGLDLTKATAFAFTVEGSAFYALQVPGLTTTWVYDFTNSAWHERADFANGLFKPWRGSCYVFAFGKHLIGGSDGTLYELSAGTYKYGNDPIVSDRVSPHEALPTFQRQRFPKFEIDMTVGSGGVVSMRYSDDGGNTWGDWRSASMGALGKYGTRVLFWRCGFARDRVWNVRVTDPVQADIVSVQA
jgi:hypothetical protein